LAHAGLRTLLAVLEVLRPALTEPGWRTLVVLFGGWLRTTDTHAVTEALVVTGVAGKRHHEAFHRFFSRGTWSPDAFGERLFRLLVGLLAADAPIRAVIDDTLAPKKGPHVFGIGSHLDAVRSTRRQRIFCFGHCWVVLAVLVSVPFARRTFALPLLLRLYRNKSECEKKRHPYRKKTELARELIEVLASWSGPRRIELAMDSAFCNDTVLHRLPEHIAVFGSMRPDAVLTDAPLPRSPRQPGRKRLRGEVLRKPEALARDGRSQWQSCKAVLYGQTRTVQFKTCVAQWYRVCGTRMLRVVVVKVHTGNIGLRVFFCTDLNVLIPALLEAYAGRWSIEVCFRELKQLLGFADSSARKQAAVERTAPFVAFTYSVIVLWALRSRHAILLATPPLRPWYPHKRGLCFADLLRAARRATSVLPIPDRAPLPDNLPNRHHTPLPRSQQRFRFAG
jgi:DDE superfamily endonuclease